MPMTSEPALWESVSFEDLQEKPLDELAYNYVMLSIGTADDRSTCYHVFQAMKDRFPMEEISQTLKNMRVVIGMINK